MCVSPSTLKNGVVVGCRRCWQCRANRVQDWVGRNVCEARTSQRSYSIRLSYGRSKDGHSNHLRSVLLMYSDIQKMLKRMRKKYSVRYMIAGEYGSTFKRAHWHGIFHFSGNILPEWGGAHLTWSQEQWDKVGGIHIPEWADYNEDRTFRDYMGHVHIKEAEYAHMRYALKYMLKDQLDPLEQLKFAMSKKPPLGSEYLLQMARETAQAGLAPQDLNYRFPVVLWNGERVVQQFMMQGKVAEMYIQEYLAEWKRLHGKAWWPDSELIDTYYEYGRMGRQENLRLRTIEDVEYRERTTGIPRGGLAAMNEPPSPALGEERPKTLKEYWKESQKPFITFDRNAFDDWELDYYGKRWPERPGRGPELNDRQQLEWVLAFYECTERQFWAQPWEHIELQWRIAGDAFEERERRNLSAYGGAE